MRIRARFYRIEHEKPGAYVMSRWFEGKTEDEIDEKVAQYARGKYGYEIEWGD